MRRLAIVVGCALFVSACAVIAGLDAPAELADASDAAVDGARPEDPRAPGDAAPILDAGAGDGDAGRTCTGTVLASDSFEPRDAAASKGWLSDSNGGEGTIEVANGQLHVRVPPATSGQNLRRQLYVTKPGAKRMCASFTVIIDKPDDTSAYFGNGDTTFGFVRARAPDGGANYHGVTLVQPGVALYAERGATTGDERLVSAPIGAKWNVLVDADYVADKVTIAINDKVETFATIRPSEAPEASFFLGIRNFGPAPEAEAFFDDVLVTAD